MTTTLAATYVSLADALRTRQELQELRIPAEDISVAMRRGSSGDPDQPEVLTLGWLERAITGWPSEPGETDIGRVLARAGIHELIATHLAHDVDHGGVLIATVIDAPAHQEPAELIMSRRARYPDLVGDVQEHRVDNAKRSATETRARLSVYAPSDFSPRA